MNLEGSRILVTGGAGLIGSHVTDQLLAERPEEIVAFDKDFSRLSENRSLELNYGAVRLVSGDLTRPEEVREVLEGVDFVVHAASLLTRNAAENLRSGFDVNILGTFNVLEACAASKVKKVIYSSSISLYGHPVARPMTEEHPFNTETLYGAGKVSSELLLRVFKKMKGLDYVALRYAPVYGPRQHYRGNINQYIPECFDRIDQGLAPVIYGDGSEPIDFVYVGDVARANVHALKSPVTGEAFNIGTGMVTMIRDVARMIVEITGASFQPANAPHGDRFGLMKSLFLDVSKAEKVLGFKADVPLKEGLKRYYRWRKNRTVLETS